MMIVMKGNKREVLEEIHALFHKTGLSFVALIDQISMPDLSVLEITEIFATELHWETGDMVLRVNSQEGYSELLFV